jgi:hypothetical protein
MLMRTSSQAVLAILAMTVTFAPAHAITQEELVTKLKSAGYSYIGQMKSTPEGNVVKATKGGREVELVVDGTGQIKERNRN